MLGTRVFFLPKEWSVCLNPSITPAETSYNLVCRGHWETAESLLQRWMVLAVVGSHQSPSVFVKSKERRWDSHVTGLITAVDQREALWNKHGYTILLWLQPEVCNAATPYSSSVWVGTADTTRVDRADRRLQEETHFSWDRERQQTCLQNLCSGGAPPAAGGWAAEGSEKAA